MFNTGLPVTAACEPLFSVGKGVFGANLDQLSDKKIARLLMCCVW